MKRKTKKSFLSDVPSWALALITAIFSLIFLLILANLLGNVLKQEHIGEIIAYIIYDLIIATACFFICRQNPKSIWHVPVIINMMGIISALVEPNFWITDLWMLICGGWVLSLAGAMIGALAGRNQLKVKITGIEE